jgi:hypothetical protein
MMLSNAHREHFVYTHENVLHTQRTLSNTHTVHETFQHTYRTPHVAHETF